MAERHRVIIIGGGVVGLAIFRALALHEWKPLLLEKGSDLLSGASKANSALLHTGFDAPAGSRELSCIRAGRQEFLEIRAALGLPLLSTGALVIAWNAAEEGRLEALAVHGRENGVNDLELLDRAALRAREPHLAEEAQAALLVPGEAVIDPWSTPLAYARQGMALGGHILRDTEVQGGERGPCWRLHTNRGPYEADWVINAAGLYGDIVEAIAREAPFRIHPRKGQFVVFDKPAARLLTHIALPVPGEKTKGVVVAPTIFGNLLVGPTAEEQESRSDTATDGAVLARLIARGRQILPALAQEEVTASYAGLRPATQFKDYQIAVAHDLRWVTVAGIRSTGLTGALGIARSVTEEMGLGPPRAQSGPTPAMPSLSAYETRPYLGKEGCDIACHCEQVTVAEIDAALSSPPAATDLDGIKRRTRAMMGRCQGFYCAARIRDRLEEGRWRPVVNVKDQAIDIAATDILIVGAGPAGLSAAAELSRLGLGASVTILEREQEAGGIPRHCGHKTFGLREFGRLYSGPTYAQRLAETIGSAQLRLGTSVVEIAPGGRVRVTDGEGARWIDARRVLLATGMRETPRPPRLISGIRSASIMNTATLQQYVYLYGRAPFRHPVILGGELVAFSAILTLRHVGVRPRALIAPEAVSPLLFPASLLCGPIFDVPVLRHACLLGILGEGTVEAVAVGRGAGREILACDGVILAGLFRPENALIKGGSLAMSCEGGPRVSAWRCSDPAYFAAGNGLGILRTTGTCWRQGRAAARAIAASLA
ncbi:MAG TPA: FAD-dependent oxidoreductase [Dongiaceae bacterium]|jgi:glycerol-3-phosphate dehydrogenase|nr:FAD-dependent oxidoreductase [Dongiaceae bacterium]